jgi:hypothetical protein
MINLYFVNSPIFPFVIYQFYIIKNTILHVFHHFHINHQNSSQQNQFTHLSGFNKVPVKFFTAVRKWAADITAITVIAHFLTMQQTGKIIWKEACISRINECTMQKIEVWLLSHWLKFSFFPITNAQGSGLADIIEESRTKPPCKQFMRNQSCEYGLNCKYSHIMFDRFTGMHGHQDISYPDHLH